MALTLDRKSPGIFGILFGAVLGVALGGLLGLVHLVAQPVEVVSVAPKVPDEDVRYFIQGAVGGGGAKDIERKQERVESGSGEIAFTEREMNAWAGAAFKSVAVEKKEKESSVMIIVGVPNFRLVGKELQMGIINTINFLGTECPLVLQARGVFVRRGGGLDFQPSEAYLGGLPLHRVPVLLSLATTRLGLGKGPPPVIDAMLKRAVSIVASPEELVVRMP